MAQDNDNTTQQVPSDRLNDPQSRRRFLRAAVIGTAGAAGAAAVAGVAMTRNGASSPSIVSHYVGAAQQQVSGSPTTNPNATPTPIPPTPTATSLPAPS
ncbi:MAG: hypothetical protein ACLQUY_06760 [Ktedonobacterales bacterium]